MTKYTFQYFQMFTTEYLVILLKENSICLVFYLSLSWPQYRIRPTGSWWAGIKESTGDSIFLQKRK